MLLTAAAVATLAVTACVDRGPGPQRKVIDPAYIAENLLSAPPTVLTNTVNADLGGKVTYLGNVVDKTSLGPGDKVEIKHYWKVVAEPGAQWRVFSHVRGTGNSADFMNVDETDMRLGHGPATWKPGEIIQDTQSITLKPDWQSKTATVIVGMFPKGKHGIDDRMPVVSGPSMENAVIAVVFPIDLTKAPPPAGTVVVKHAPAAITIDGVADDPGWVGAMPSAEFPTGESSGDPPGKTIGRMTWDEQNLYVFVQADDPIVGSTYTKDDDSIWKDDVIELFIDADGNGRGYIELQVNPNNAIFDKWYPAGRVKDEPPEWLAWSSGMQAKVRVRGTVNNNGDTDGGWDAEFAIPWAAVKGNDPAMKVQLPPAPGTKMRMNVVRVDYKDGKATIASWNRITYSDFHALDRMLNVVFADATGKTAPEPAGSGSAAGSATPGSGSAAPGSGSAAPKAGSGSAAPKAGSGSAAPKAPRAPKAGGGSGSAAPAPAPALTPKRPDPRPRGPGAAGSGAGSGS
jgi:hypothetical protein